MSAQRLLRSAPVILMVVNAGCATAPAGGAAARSAEIEQNTVELRAENAGYVRKIEELQNRIFILEDQIDSRRVAEAPLGAPIPASSRRIGVAAHEATAPVAALSSSEEDSNVEYAGEAALPSRRSRDLPVLRLAGSGRALTVALATQSPTDRAGQLEALHLYHQALDALRAGHQAVALTTFRRFLTRYPHHDYADNAQYWVGECYYDLSQFKASVLEFRRVVERYPHGNKVPDALLKIGFAHLATGDRHDARLALESLKRIYPHHAVTRLALDRLAQLQTDDRSQQPAVSLELSRR
jgi:tol-pal system protein YbgF